MTYLEAFATKEKFEEFAEHMAWLLATIRFQPEDIRFAWDFEGVDVRFYDRDDECRAKVEIPASVFDADPDTQTDYIERVLWEKQERAKAEREHQRRLDLDTKRRQYELLRAELEVA